MIEADWQKNPNGNWYKLAELVPIRAIPEEQTGIMIFFDENNQVLLVGWRSLYHRMQLTQENVTLKEYPEVLVTWTSFEISYYDQRDFAYLVDYYRPPLKYDIPEEIITRIPVEFPF
jgi:hypothetical protein